MSAAVQRGTPARLARALGVGALVAALAGCSLWGSGPAKPKPADLGPNVAVLGVRQAWAGKVGAIDRLPLDVHVNGYRLTLASADGTVASIDARTGADLWRAQLGTPLAAGVGSDGKRAAVGSSSNQLIVLADG
ncbi:MAG: PQQ-binding-like beta-propeller repeat protein, partial [Burkholderiaceae bacterium]